MLSTMTNLPPPPSNTVFDDIFGQVSRAIKRGDSGPVAFDLLLQVLSRQFDNGDAASALGVLHNFGMPNEWYPLRGLLYRVFVFYLLNRVIVFFLRRVGGSFRWRNLLPTSLMVSTSFYLPGIYRYYSMFIALLLRVILLLPTPLASSSGAYYTVSMTEFPKWSPIIPTRHL